MTTGSTRFQGGFSLTETLIGTVVVTLIVLVSLGMATFAIQGSAPSGALEQARLATLSDAVDARAATMYSSGAVIAISGGGPSTGSAGSTTSIQNQTIAFTYGSLAQASLPLRQGAPAPNSFVYSGLAPPSPGPSGTPCVGACGGPQPSPGPTSCFGSSCGSGKPSPAPTGVPTAAPTPTPTPHDHGGGGDGGGGGGGHNGQ